MEVMTLQHVSHAVAHSLTLMEFSDEEVEGLQTYSLKSRHLIHQAVGCRLHWRRLQLTDMTDRQERQSRWTLDQQAGRKFLEDHKGPGKFTGRVGKQTTQTDLKWETPVGAIYVSRSEINTQDFVGGTGKISAVTWRRATLLRVGVQADAIETTAKVIQQATQTWVSSRRPEGDGGLMEPNETASPKREGCQKQEEAPWGNVGSMGIRIDSEWWWVSEGMGAAECLREWIEVVQSTAESMEMGFLFQQPTLGWGQSEQGPVEGGVGLPATSGDVTVTLVYAEDLTSVAGILSTPVHTENGSVTRKVVVHGGSWKQDALPLAWELFFEQGGFSPHAKCKNRGCTCSKPFLAVLTSDVEYELADEGLRGRSSAEVVSSVVEEKSMECIAPVEETGGKRRLGSFCQNCWKWSDFRSNNEEVRDMGFLFEAGVFKDRCIVGDSLRGEVTEVEWSKFIKHYLKPGKDPGPSKVPNELIKKASS